MTRFNIVVHDHNRESQPKEPWTASLSVDDAIMPEVIAKGKTPALAVINLVALDNNEHELLTFEPEECPDCGSVKGTEGYRSWHDDGRCMAHRQSKR